MKIEIKVDGLLLIELSAKTKHIELDDEFIDDVSGLSSVVAKVTGVFTTVGGITSLHPGSSRHPIPTVSRPPAMRQHRARVCMFPSIVNPRSDCLCRYGTARNTRVWIVFRVCAEFGGELYTDIFHAEQSY